MSCNGKQKYGTISTCTQKEGGVGRFSPKLGMGELVAGEETWLKQKLREERRSARWLARQIGYSYTQTHRFVTGEQPPSMRACRKLAAVFGMTEQEVMREVGRLSPLPDDYDKAQEQELKEILQELRYSDRKTLIEFAQFLLGRDEDNDGEDVEDEGDEGD